MEIEYALIADYAEVVSGKLYLMGGGWDAIAMAQAPGPARLAVAAGVRIGWEETNRVVPVTKQVEDDDGQMLVKLEAAVNVGRPPHLAPGTAQLAQIAANVSLQVEAFGGYRVVLAVDGPGGPVRHLPFRVVQTPR